MDIVPEYEFHIDEDFTKIIELNYEIIEEFEKYIRLIDQIDLSGKESFISIKLFTISYIDFYSEIINLFKLKIATGIEYYSRSLIELTLYVRGLSISSEFLSYLKVDNYKQLKASRNDLLGKKRLEPCKAKKEIETLNNRIGEHSEINIHGKKLTLNSTIESLFNILDCEMLYSNYYRYFSRKIHVNIFEIQSRYRNSSGLIFKPRILIDDFMLSQYSIFECNQYMITSLTSSLDNLENKDIINEKNKYLLQLTSDLIKKHKTNVT